MTRARTESNPDNFERTDGGYRFIKAGATLPNWANATEIEAVTITQWKMMRCPVRAIVGSDVLMQDPCWKNANMFQAAAGQPVLWNFRLLSRFENAYEFLDHAGEWYLDSAAGWIYYIPRAEENLATAKVELPVLEALIDGRGELDKPVSHIRFEGLTFAYATWLGPSSPDGYAVDQSGFHLVGEGHQPNIIGHDEHTVRTPGNVRFRFATHIEFRDNDFVHLGGVGLDFATGSQHNAIIDNRFEDISSAGFNWAASARKITIRIIRSRSRATTRSRTTSCARSAATISTLPGSWSGSPRARSSATTTSSTCRGRASRSAGDGDCSIRAAFSDCRAPRLACGGCTKRRRRAAATGSSTTASTTS
jgi:hypothetical protein